MATSPPPTRPQFAAFDFTEASLAGRTITLRYRLCGGPDDDLEFVETLHLPAEVPAPDPDDHFVQHLLDGIHRVFGVSYFKAAVPKTLIAPPVSEADADFWDTLYTVGLGEFYYRNQLDPTGRVTFPRHAADSIATSAPSRATRKVLVLAGGGKDSLVAREVVRHSGVPADALSLGTAPWIRRSVRAAGLRHLVIERHFDRSLIALNDRGAWNGHVPISACIAFVTTLVAYAGGYEAVVVANERSANEGNVSWRGMTINHQWSKGSGFEAGFQAWCKRKVHAGPTYFSLLRPMGELHIAAAFARHAQYFDDFTSCNRNFRLNPTDTPARWCGQCPKCTFVQLILAPHLSADQTQRVFGGDFLGDTGNRAHLEGLVGVRGLKPFECVGTKDESQAALARLAKRGRLSQSLLDWYTTKAAGQVHDAEAAWERAHTLSEAPDLPDEWGEALSAYLDSTSA
jgi:hypothetical protein